MGSIAFGVLVCVFARADDTADLRTWRDRGGKFELRATLEKIEFESVVLRRTDGVEITVARDRLSAEDQKFVEEQAAKVKPEAPFESADGKRNPATDNFVAVTWEKNGKTYFLPGLVFQTDGKTSYVVTPASRQAGPPDDGKCQLRWRHNGVRHEAVSTGTTRVSSRHRWVLSGEASKLPPPLPRTSAVHALKPVSGASVEVVGYTVGLEYEQQTKGAFLEIRVPAKIQRVGRTVEGEIVSLHLEGRQLKNIDWGLVATADGQVLAPLFPRGVDPLDNPNQLGVGVSFESLDEVAEPVLKRWLMLPVRGDAREIEYEFIVEVDDPLNRIRSPQLLLKPMPPNKISYDQHRGRSETLLTDAAKVELNQREPAVEVAAQLGSKTEPLTKHALVGRYKTLNLGHEATNPFFGQLVGTLADGQTIILGTVPFHYDPHSRRRANSYVPDIPGFDGKPVEAPQAQKHPKGGYVVTWPFTRVDDAPETTSDKFPVPQAAAESLAGASTREREVEISTLTVRLESHFGDRLERNLVCYSTDGKWLYLADSQKVLHKVDAATLKEDRVLQLPESAGDLAISRAGLLLALPKAGRVWVLNPLSLEVRRAVGVAFPQRLAASPATELGAVLGYSSLQDNWDAAGTGNLTLVDFEKGQPLHRLYGPHSRFRKSDGGIVAEKPILYDKIIDMKMTADGKQLIVGGMLAELYRLEGTDLIFAGRSGISSLVRRFVLSPDGKRLIARGGFHPEPGLVFTEYELPDLTKATRQIESDFGDVAAIDPSSGRLFVVSASAIKIYAVDGKLLGWYGVKLPRSRRIVVHPDGKRLLCIEESSREDSIRQCLLPALGK